MKRKELMVFAGPNASGKSTVIKATDYPGEYICPDSLVPPGKRQSVEAYLEAMQQCEKMRKTKLKNGESFTFETVLSSPEKLAFLRLAKKQGYKITVHYITTNDYNINIKRAASRQALGGHGVPTDKLIARWERTMSLMYSVIEIADIARVYDNSGASPVLVFAKQPDGTQLLLNREQRHPWTQRYIIDKAAARGIPIAHDLNVWETRDWLASIRP
ncbi:MAG: zeta toxin family protein [Oscillospiraceae bacterium]|nr:zeta toxin family protein [Oscillospiraceae bacterium]